MGKKSNELIGTAAELSNLAGLSVVEQQISAIKTTGYDIESALNDANLLRLFSRDRSTLSPQEIETVNRAAVGIQRYVEQLEQASLTLQEIKSRIVK